MKIEKKTKGWAVFFENGEIEFHKEVSQNFTSGSKTEWRRATLVLDEDSK